MQTEVKPMRPRMSPVDAYFNGFRHGSQGKVTRDICCVTKGTEAYKTWHKGYTDGERAGS